MKHPIESSRREAPGDYRRKIVEPSDLRQIIAGLRESSHGDAETIIVHCHGCFDIVHPGHIRYLQFARSQGDLLVVSITGDAAIDKGAQRPYIPQELRAENLAALEIVDYVVVDTNETACELLEVVRPDIYVKGEEYATNEDPRFLAERRIVESHGGRVIFSSGQVVFSSSRLLESLNGSPELATQRLRHVCQRHDIGRPGLARILCAMRGARVLVVGDTVVDRYVLCDAGGVASESPMMSLVELGHEDYLGGAALLASQLGALGARVTLVTRCGTGDDGAWVRHRLDESGVHVRDITQGSPTALRTRFVVDDHKMLKVDRAKSIALDSVTLRETQEILAEVAADAQVGIVFDGGGGLISESLWNGVGTTIRGRLSFLAGTSNEPQGRFQSLSPLDLLVTSERRLRIALNDFAGGLSTLAYRMMNNVGARRMIVTVGKRGLVTFDRQSHDPNSPAWSERLRSEYLGAMADRIADRLGCGETVLAVSTLAIASGASLMQASYLASAAVSVQIALPGTRAVAGDEISRWVGQRPELENAAPEHFSVQRSRAAGARRKHEFDAV